MIETHGTIGNPFPRVTCPPVMANSAQMGPRGPADTAWQVFLTCPTVDEPTCALALVTTEDDDTEEALTAAEQATGYARELLRVQAFGRGQA